MAILRLLVGLIITIFIAYFTVLNREQVDFMWSPFNDYINLPVYAIALASMAFGFVVGGIIVWFNAGSYRKEKRKQKKYIKILEKELGRLKEDKFASVSLPASAPVENVISLSVNG